MSDVAILAYGAVSALGEGPDAFTAGIPGEPPRVAIPRTADDELREAGLARPFVARAPVPAGTADRATWLLRRALGACLDELQRVRPDLRAGRMGLVAGTSSGGMRAAEVALARAARGLPVSDPHAATYAGPVAQAVRELELHLDPVLVVLGACASSALAIGLGCRLLARGEGGACDVVLAGGFDDVTVLVAAGFEALRATTASPPPRPFRVGRDGTVLGEGAAFVALARARACARGREPARAFVTGFGAGSDAVHLTAPDREGTGLARAVDRARAEAGRPRNDLVSPQATATPFNDPVEARVFAAALGRDDTPGRGPVVVPFKAQIGHTLGAAGALETLLCVDALERGVLPGAAGEGELDPEARVTLLARAEHGTPSAALKTASAFGGSNAALVVQRSVGTARPPRPAFVSRAVHVAAAGPEWSAIEALAVRLGAPSTPDRVARGDGLVRLALAAVVALRDAEGELSGAGIVVGSPLATLETNALVAARIRERGARLTEPRRFPYTSPNAVAGECSIAFGLTGPGFAVAGGLHAGLEALVAATLLVEAGDSERVVVVAVDDVGAAAKALGFAVPRPGAVACLVTAEAGGSPALARLRVEGVGLPRGAPHRLEGPAGHEALLPLAAPVEPGATLVLRCGSPPDAAAWVELRGV